ncbi:unnamed protein product [Cyberlindnera jadinii]|uniref:PIG-P domain-containing protein n=1 Tax=Cyberlindnera jadinii (strain ATCC 18201 / CBS 1600 / BCRC 20928 / JCM 3617 / NBRC 0987 / NRRL Y-1542) TaxID=983966 RepID=A0A0H5CB32_CYBJN|nr:unnamed protein product [Cyberlindnera jadinii]
MARSRRSSLRLQPSLSTSSLIEMSQRECLTKPLIEYEDILPNMMMNESSLKLTDLLARESDVTVSNQISSLIEYRGFAWHLLVTVIHTLWLLWTFLPENWLHYIGVHYYPSRWWSLAVSNYILILFLYSYIALQFWNVEVEAIPRDDLRAICDGDQVVEKDIVKYGWKDTNGVFDLRISDVNEVLYD